MKLKLNISILNCRSISRNMTKNISKLTEIPRNQLDSLRDLYLKSWPKHFLGYYTLENYIQWFEKDSNLLTSMKVYSLNGDWSDGTFLIWDQHHDMLFLNTINDSNERLEEALHLVDWTQKFELTSFLERHRPAVLNVLSSKGIKIDLDDLNLLYFLPKEDAIKFSIEERKDFFLKALTTNDAVTANAIWKLRDENSIHFLKHLTKFNVTLGAFRCDNKELVSWCFRAQGPLAILQTKDIYQRKGLAKYVVSAMVQHLGQQGKDVYTFIMEDNIPSGQLFTRLGFKVVAKTYWIRTNWSS